MNLKSKSIRAVKGVSLIAASLLMFAGAPSAQAANYQVSARFSDGGIQGETLFTGAFSWDGSTLSNFTGGLTQSMWAWQASSSSYKNRMNACGTPPCALWDTDLNTADGNAPLLNLSYQLGGITAPDANGDVLATVFLKNTTNTFSGGGYDTGDKYKYGNPGPSPVADGNTPNMNAYFTLAFNALDPFNTLTAMSKIVYGDCTAMGLMGPMMTGSLCMTGHSSSIPGYVGSMGGAPTNLSITAVPVPAAVWLFGGALISLFGANRRKSVLPA